MWKFSLNYIDTKQFLVLSCKGITIASTKTDGVIKVKDIVCNVKFLRAEDYNFVLKWKFAIPIKIKEMNKNYK